LVAATLGWTGGLQSIFQCPYCRGWEIRDRPWELLATGAPALDFALFLTGWSRDLVVFTQGLLDEPPAWRPGRERWLGP
jgi:thioredoxin reductase